MHARLSPHPSNNRALTPLALNTAATSVAVLDPLHSHRKSWICEPIREEPSSLDLPARLDPQVEHKRHHRPRAPLIRTNSAPQLISTTTTKPIHIHHLM